MKNLLEIAKENSKNSTKSIDDYRDTIYELIDSMIMRASQYTNVTGIFLAQIVDQTPGLFQVYYRETNSDPIIEHKHTHGSDPFILCIDTNCISIEDIAHHYAKLGFLTGVKIFEYTTFIQFRCLISWSDEEDIDNKVNISKYVNGVDIYANDSHPELY